MTNNTPHLIHYLQKPRRKLCFTSFIQSYFELCCRASTFLSSTSYFPGDITNPSTYLWNGYHHPPLNGLHRPISKLPFTPLPPRPNNKVNIEATLELSKADREIDRYAIN